jgi:hypothetical protein
MVCVREQSHTSGALSEHTFLSNPPTSNVRRAEIHPDPAIDPEKASSVPPQNAPQTCLVTELARNKINRRKIRAMSLKTLSPDAHACVAQTCFSRSYGQLTLRSRAKSIRTRIYTNTEIFTNTNLIRTHTYTNTSLYEHIVLYKYVIKYRKLQLMTSLLDKASC